MSGRGQSDFVPLCISLLRQEEQTKPVKLWAALELLVPVLDLHLRSSSIAAAHTSAAKPASTLVLHNMVLPGSRLA